MTGESQDPKLDEELLQTGLQLQAIFMPQAKRHRDEAYERLKKEGNTDGQLRFVHYTSAEAALSIIRTKRMWMRNTTCMSDYREVQHGFDILDKFFSDKSKADSFVAALDACVQGVAEEGLDLFRSRRKDVRWNTYVTSVSEHEQSENKHGRLSMWRAFGGGAVRVAIVLKVPKFSQGLNALSMLFSPVSYLSENEVHAVVQEVIQNIRANREFLRSVNREIVRLTVFYMLVAGVTCLKHEGFREEREWRALYLPILRPSTLIDSSTEVVNGVPQLVYKVPLDQSVSPALADLDFSQIFDHLIIGPSSYPWVLFETFTRELAKAGIPLLRSRSGILIFPYEPERAPNRDKRALLFFFHPRLGLYEFSPVDPAPRPFLDRGSANIAFDGVDVSSDYFVAVHFVEGIALRTLYFIH